jgi:hypothetical protein
MKLSHYGGVRLLLILRLEQGLILEVSLADCIGLPIEDFLSFVGKWVIGSGGLEVRLDICDFVARVIRFVF